ncbi:hypothetical protein l13_19760 [Neisseria weaveri ATCC 51223]|nr:hypothetical protein l13_19760 [Neisseria weaveri ATCC 51223]
MSFRRAGIPVRRQNQICGKDCPFHQAAGIPARPTVFQTAFMSLRPSEN